MLHRSTRDDSSGTFVHHQRFQVEYDYPVHFTKRLFSPDNELLAQVLDRKGEGRRHRVFVCMDQGVTEGHPNLVREIRDWFHRHLDIAELVATPEIIPGGELCKSDWQTMQDLLVTLGNNHLCRQSFLIAIGGGALLDMAGFAAALVHRGIRLIRLPSTVLAQDDAGVGVKNGMNEHGMKNFLGTFAPPFAVINDLALLTSLPDEHWRAGLAEAFKVAIIKDEDFFTFLCRKAPALARRDLDAMGEAVRRCAVLHLDHIAKNGDPFELGTARPLDFGHWMAHKLETLSEFRITHGAAVAAGIALDSYYAVQQGLITEAELQTIWSGLTECGFPLWYPEMDERDGSGRLRILEGLEEFREHLGGTLTITLPRGIGQRVEVHHLNIDLVEQGVFALRNRQQQAGRSSA